MIGLVLRLWGMSQWIMWEVSGLFENIGTVQDGINSISMPRLVEDRPDAKDIVVPPARSSSTDVRFHYGKDKGVIDDLSLHIRPGEKVGLVGRSGAGKSTLVNLLLRFYDLEGGRILIDGQDIAAVTQEIAARADRHGDAGYVAAAPLGARQYPLRPAGCRRRRMIVDAARAGRGARFHRDARRSEGPQRLRRPCRRARREAVRRPAAARRHRPRAVSRMRRS